MSSIDALLDAIRNRDNAAARALLDREPELVHARGANGESPVMTAIYGRAGAILAMLVARGARVDVFAAAALGIADWIMEALESDPDGVHAFSPDGWTPLHLAAFFGQSDAAKLLLDHGASLKARSRNAMANTPLHAALAGQAEPVLVDLFLAYRADVNAPAASGVTPLHLAASRGSAELVEILLEGGARPEAQTDEGTTPAALAAARGHEGVAATLQQRVADRAAARPLTPAPA